MNESGDKGFPRAYGALVALYPASSATSTAQAWSNSPGTPAVAIRRGESRAVSLSISPFRFPHNAWRATCTEALSLSVRSSTPPFLRRGSCSLSPAERTRSC